LSDHATQRERLLALLELAEQSWVPLPRILSLQIACYTRRIHELRKEGWQIEIAEERQGRQRRTKYRLTGRKEYV
jgi:hypothetical protein